VSEIDDLIARARARVMGHRDFAKHARTSAELDALYNDHEELAKALEEAVREMHARELHHFEEEKLRAEAETERDALRAAIQPVLDAWNIPGIRPDYHEWAKRELWRMWSTLSVALDEMARAIDMKEKE